MFSPLADAQIKCTEIKPETRAATVCFRVEAEKRGRTVVVDKCCCKPPCCSRISSYQHSSWKYNIYNPRLKLAHKCILNVITYTKLFTVALCKFFWENDSTRMLIFPHSKMLQSGPSEHCRGHNCESEGDIEVTPRNQCDCIGILAAECDSCEYDLPLRRFKGKKTESRHSSISQWWLLQAWQDRNTSKGCQRTH